MPAGGCGVIGTIVPASRLPLHPAGADRKAYEAAIADLIDGLAR